MAAVPQVSKEVISEFKSLSSCADVSILCSTKGVVIDVAASQDYLSAGISKNISILEVFSEIKKQLSSTLEDVLNTNTVRWFSANCPEKDELLMQWRASLLSLDGFRCILIQGHECERTALSALDALTGLPNRDSFFDAIKKNKAAVGSVICFDIKDFKELNQTQGTAVGNDVLKYVANELRSSFIEATTISRVGDDQFCVVTPVQNPVQSIERFLAVFDQPVYALGQLIKVDLHTGYCAYPSVVYSLQEALDGAFFALQSYKHSEEKQVNKNWGFSKDDYTKKQRRQKLKELLGPAINKGEFYLLYQPIVDASKKLIAVEALMRWKSVSEGLVSPAEFINVAEDCPQHILTLGSWALRYACEEIAQLGPEFADLKVSVNVSPVQFKKPDFIQDVRNVLMLTNLAPHRLQLEITEGVLVSNPKASAVMLKMLKDLGVSLAIDDFGIGYSSLSYLKNFALDNLKIDKSFVDDVYKSAKDEAICASIVDMSKRLQVKCTAEGVENASQFEKLKALGCTAFQGYLFGKPQLLTDLTSK